MSFRTVEEAPVRLHRSELAVPGSQPRFFEKAARSEADAVFLDLEDSVAPEEKERARNNVVEAVNDIDWGDKTLTVRVNGLDTSYMYRDIIEVGENAGSRLDLIMVPKVGTAGDVYAVDVLLSQIEAAKGISKRIGLSLLMETALGVQNVDEIARASRRTEALNFGPADYAASTGARTVEVGALHPDYAVLTDPDASGARVLHGGDMWHYPLARMVAAARASGLRPIDGPFGDYSDPEGFRVAAGRAAALGCEGKWAIHPAQIAVANEVFSPSEIEVERAHRILEAMDQARKAGEGAASLDGRLIDIASIRQAQLIARKAEMIRARASS
ncbi:MAG: HpcH/HpaI aldolase/citrate lyase family protein [Alphaproteobacteria bacterium]